jgi:hypothetical protein
MAPRIVNRTNRWVVIPVWRRLDGRKTSENKWEYKKCGLYVLR